MVVDRRDFLLACAAISVAGCSRSILGWPKGYVSLTYDDGLPSQLDIAVPQLEREGLRGTFFLTWNNMKDRAADWAAIAHRGHELGNHTVSHRCDLRLETAESFKSSEIDPVERWLTKVEGPRRSRDFAYPCDVTDLGPGNANQQADTYARILRSAGILRARTSQGPPNSLRWTEEASYRLQALALGYDAKTFRDVRDYIAEAITERRWAILVLHEIGVGKLGDGSVSPAAHEQLLRMIKQMRVPCGTLESAIRYARIRDS